MSRSPTIGELESCPTFTVSDEHNWDPTAEMFVSTVERGHVVCASDSYDMCMSDSCDVYDCLHEFDSVQGSPTQIMATDQNFRTSSRGRPKLTLLEVGIRLRKSKRHIEEHYSTQHSICVVTLNAQIQN